MMDLPPPVPPMDLFAPIINAAKAHPMDERYNPVLILSAVGHTKSTSLNRSALEDLITNRHTPILYGSKSATVVKSTNIWLRNKCLKWYGDPGPLWEAQRFSIPGWEDTGERDPTFTGVTLGTSFEGVRANALYLDDPIDRTSQTSKTYREDAIQWYDEDFKTRGNPGCPTIIIGSPWHPDDLYMELIKRGIVAHVYPMVKCKIPKIFKKYPNVHWHGMDYRWLWRSRWAALKWNISKIRDWAGGTIPFLQRYLCSPEAILGARIKPGWIYYYDVISKSLLSSLTIWMGVDPAFSDRDIKRNSRTAIVVIGFDPKGGPIYVLDTLADWWAPSRAIDAIDDMMTKWKPRRLVVEDTTASKSMIEQLMTRPYRFKVDPQPPGGNKVARLDTMEVPIRRAKETHGKVGVCFHRSQQDLIEEILHHPEGTTNDIFDCLEAVTRKHINRGPVRFTRAQAG